jgi:signal transduction histidine kinase
MNVGNDIEITGLGIPAKDMINVKNLVNKLDGRLWIESEEREGTSFSVLLPINPGETRVVDGYD